MHKLLGGWRSPTARGGEFYVTRPLYADDTRSHSLDLASALSIRYGGPDP
jgi:hypothetical protein